MSTKRSNRAKYQPKVKAALLKDAETGNYTHQQLANKHEVKLPTVADWLRKAGFQPARQTAQALQSFMKDLGYRWVTLQLEGNEPVLMAMKPEDFKKLVSQAEEYQTVS